MLQGLLQASELVHKKFKNFVKERLVEVEKSIFQPISKSNIKTSNEKETPRNKKEKQTFGVIAEKPNDLHEASLPLSIASPNSSLYQSDKAEFRYYIEIIKLSILLLYPNWIINH